jgi:hypothetical protein
MEPVRAIYARRRPVDGSKTQLAGCAGTGC